MLDYYIYSQTQIKKDKIRNQNLDKVKKEFKRQETHN